jgi:hypothetical protein
VTLFAFSNGDGHAGVAVPGNTVRGSIEGENHPGWFYKESVTFLEPNRDANVIVSGEPVASTLNSEGYATAHEESLRQEFPGFTQHAFQPTLVFGGRPGYLRMFSWTSPDHDEPIVQLQLYYAAGGRGYVATATATKGSFEQLETQLREILLSVRIAPPQPQ